MSCRNIWCREVESDTKALDGRQVLWPWLATSTLAQPARQHVQEWIQDAGSRDNLMQCNDGGTEISPNMTQGAHGWFQRARCIIS